MSKLHSISLTTANAKSASSAPIAGRAAKSIRQFSDCYDLAKPRFTSKSVMDALPPAKSATKQ
jgi:hypothetical protein